MPKKPCDECQDTGWILESKDGREVARRCSCFKKKQKQSLFTQANIPARYSNCRLDNFEIHDPSHKDVLNLCKQFVKNYPAQDVGLLFIGPCGVGKTHLATAIINELILKRNALCYFCDFRELIRNIQSTYSSSSTHTESDVLSPVFQADIVVLDELGAKRTTAWVEDTVFYIINQRYNNRKLTLFTSNFLDSEDDEVDDRDEFYKKNDDTLIDRIGVRLRSRIYEMCKVVNVEGKDYRKAFKQASYRF
ncbi:ATP-binding protein [Acidobacteriota bacterium]